MNLMKKPNAQNEEAPEAPESLASKISSWAVGILTIGAFLFMVCMFSAGLYRAIASRVTSPPTPPPEWSIACDGNGYYAPMAPGGTVFDTDASKNKHVAMNRAHHYYKVFARMEKEAANKAPMPPRNWSVCEP